MANQKSLAPRSRSNLYLGAGRLGTILSLAQKLIDSLDPTHARIGIYPLLEFSEPVIVHARAKRDLIERPRVSSQQSEGFGVQVAFHE